jgi:hypothetical protein
MYIYTYIYIYLLHIYICMYIHCVCAFLLVCLLLPELLHIREKCTKCSIGKNMFPTYYGLLWRSAFSSGC